MLNRFLRPAPDLDSERYAIIAQISQAVIFDGWSALALKEAAQSAGISEERAQQLFPRLPISLISAHAIYGDMKMRAAIEADQSFSQLNTRDKIEQAIMLRFQELNAEREAIKQARALGMMARYSSEYTRALARTCDCIWTCAGDQSRDYNRYTKRLLLGSIYCASMLVWLQDDGEDLAKTRGFVRQRIQGLVRFMQNSKSLFTNSKMSAAMPRCFTRSS